jgi:hypothetical protein
VAEVTAEGSPLGVASSLCPFIPACACCPLAILSWWPASSQTSTDRSRAAHLRAGIVDRDALSICEVDPATQGLYHRLLYGHVRLNDCSVRDFIDMALSGIQPAPGPGHNAGRSAWARGGRRPLNMVGHAARAPPCHMVSRRRADRVRL